MENYLVGDEHLPLTEENLPENVRALTARMKNFRTAESLQKALEFQPGPDDVILTTGVKCGTTWTQHILHGLRSGGDVTFEDINDVFPLLDFHHDITEGKGSLYDPQPFGPPKFYKSHLLYQMTPKGAGKYIVITRDPKDAAISYYHYYLDWTFTGQDLQLEEFVEWAIVRDRPAHSFPANAYQMRHLMSWYPHRKDKNVLWLHYEDLKADLSQCIKLLSDFVGIAAGNQDVLALVEKQASLAFMAKQKCKFDAHTLKLSRNEAIGLPREAGIKNNTGLVRNGHVNEGARTLSAVMNQKMDEKWKQLLEPVTGFGTYKEMRAAINKELGRNFSRF